MRVLPLRNETQTEKVAFFTPFQPNLQSFCGHKVDVQRLPKTNCVQCWTFFFMSNVKFTQTIAKVLLSEGGEAALTQQHGAKFVKKAKWFFSKVAEAKQVSDEVQAEIDTRQLQDKEYDVVISSDLAREQAEAEEISQGVTDGAV